MKVFYNPQQNAVNKSFSPSTQKPAKVVDAWKVLGIELEIVEPTACTIEDLSLAHNEAYVRGVLGGWINNGFHNKLKTVADSLPWTTGSFVSAALHAFTTGESCVSPTSGFHHAEYGEGGGFCTFNGLMVATHKLQQAGATKIGILDLDMHYGNGTDQILKTTADSLTVKVVHYTYGGHPLAYSDPDEWMEILPTIVQAFEGCQVVLYQAGADPHEDDPLGGILTTEQLSKRDEIVFTELKKLGVPVAWNLAGGYQEDFSKVLEIHNNTALAFVATL
jgi:acetoin utilization deacetylase AcuC-like enzyme